MNQYKWTILTIMLFIFFKSVSAQSEEKSKHELSVFGKGSFSSLTYNHIDNMKLNNKYAIGGGLQYSLYIGRKWSISVGAEYQQYRAEALFSDLSDSYRTTDIEGTEFDFQFYTPSYKEQQLIDMVDIPVMFRYETATPFTNSFIYYAIGIQWGIPLSSEYKATAYGLETSGHFQQWDATLDMPAFMGFGEWNTVRGKKQTLDINNAYSLLLEIGFKQRLNEKQNVYVAFYSDFGLNNLVKEKSSYSALVEYNSENPMVFEMNPLFYSAPQQQGQPYATKVKIKALGIKIQYSLNL